MELLLLGNPALAVDDLALKVGAELQKRGHTTRHVDDPLELYDLDLDDKVILDVAEGVPRVVLVTEPESLVLGRLCSLHDLDAAYLLKLRKAMGRETRLRIIAIPRTMGVMAAVKAVEELLRSLERAAGSKR